MEIEEAKIMQCSGFTDDTHFQVKSNNEDGYGDWSRFGSKKIEATTDNSLELFYHGGRHEFLPQIPQSFIEAYVRAEGKITEVNVEMEKYSHAPHFKDLDKPDWFQVKTREDNTIIIHPTKTYSREEVIHYCRAYAHDEACNDNWNENKWIEENL